MKKSAIVTSVATVALSLLAPQFAMADETVVKSATVKYGDLNLASTAGANALYQRIRAAAHRVCKLDYEPPYAMHDSGKRECVGRAIDQAIIKVNSPVLVAMYQAKKNPAAG